MGFTVSTWDEPGHRGATKPTKGSQITRENLKIAQEVREHCKGYLHDFPNAIFEIGGESEGNIGGQIGDADALCDDFDCLLWHKTHLDFNWTSIGLSLIHKGGLGQGNDDGGNAKTRTICRNRRIVWIKIEKLKLFYCPKKQLEGQRNELVSVRFFCERSMAEVRKTTTILIYWGIFSQIFRNSVYIIILLLE